MLTHAALTPGHTLIVPKRHDTTIDELSEAELLGLFSLRGRVCTALRDAFEIVGFNFA